MELLFVTITNKHISHLAPAPAPAPAAAPLPFFWALLKTYLYLLPTIALQ